MATITKEQVEAGVKTVVAIGEAIRDLKQIPSGELYARVMSHMSFEAYDAAIRALINAGVVREDGYHLLHWIGPIKT